MVFEDIKVSDKVFSIIYGLGEVTIVAPEIIDGFYYFTAKYKDATVTYTVDGKADWNNDVEQTVFYLNNVDLKLFSKIHYPSRDDLTLKYIKRHVLSPSLRMQCPSGILRKVSKCPARLVKAAIKAGKTKLFQKEV